MARIEEKIAEIVNADLRQAIAEEVAKLKKRTRFGLVFEEHQPEVVPIHGARIKRDARVALKTGSLADIWRVLSVKDGQAHCEKERGEYRDAPIRESFAVNQLIVVRRMGEAIYPALTPMNAVYSGDPTQPHHVLIEADNYHALQLMLFPYEGKVDCIYIDPPYNTGARDWKYNNDYVDGNDAWQHSKWLAMMSRRLRLAQRLMNQESGVLIVTIDDYELSHLDCLLEDLFVGWSRYIVTIEHSKRGRRGKNFAKSNEFALFLVPTGTEPICEEPQGDVTGGVRNLRRTGSGSLRAQRWRKFYPFYVDSSTWEILEIGETLPLGKDKFNDAPKEIQSRYSGRSITVVWPVGDDAIEKNWHYAAPRAKNELAAGKVFAKPQSYGMQIYFSLKDKDSKKLKTVWTGSWLDASTHGTELLEKILGRPQAFDFPKSIYAVKQSILAAVLDRPDALILDFFAGSGTTLNAVNLLNTCDGGRRQVILITNNEVSEEESRILTTQGLQPGQTEWDEYGICRSVTWPRSKFTMLGRRDDGTPLPGDYLTGKQVEREKPRTIRQLGFAEGRNLTLPQRKQVAALLPAVPQSKIDDAPWFLDDEIAVSVLWDVQQASVWLEELAEADHVTEVCVVTMENRLFTALKAQIAEMLGPQSVMEDEKRPMAQGFAANLEYFRLDFLTPSEVQMGRQFAAILPLLWMMAGARGLRPAAPDPHAPWLLPEGCPFAVLMQETRFKDFVRHVETRPDLTHIFIVTNSTDTVYKLRQEWPERRVVQLYKDYLENFRINLSENPAP